MTETEWLTATDPRAMLTYLGPRAADRRLRLFLPILADALEDAGCDNADILSHCRGEGPHVRGCWIGDLILAKA